MFLIISHVTQLFFSRTRKSPLEKYHAVRHMAEARKAVLLPKF